MDQRCRLKRLTCGLVRHLLRRESAQFRIDQRQQLIGGGGIAGVDSAKDLGDVEHGKTSFKPIVRNRQRKWVVV